MELTKENKIKLPRAIFQKMCENNSVQYIQMGKAKKIFTHRNEQYIIIGSASSAKEGWISCSAVKVVLRSQYKGKYEPLSYYLDHNEVNRGLRPRDYCAVTFHHEGKEYVTIANTWTIFYPTDEGTQIDMFN
tara:strand:- start:1140 stop:1535 length:396 start_codon:yes stop_codon:yes gene_type:complete